MAVRGYPLTRGRPGRAPSARRRDREPAARAQSSSAVGDEQEPARAAASASRRTGTRNGGGARSSGTGGGPCSRACTCITAPPGSYADPPTEAAEAPAEVDVLHVHEVVLVPSADRLERGAPQPHRRARQPLHVAGLGGIDVELTVAAGEAVRGRTRPEQRVARPRRAVDGTERADGYCEPSGFRITGPTAARSGSAVEACEHRRRRARHAPRRRNCTPRRRARACRPTPRFAPPGVPEVRSGSTTRTAGNARGASAATEPSRDPLSTTTTSGSPALVVGEDRTDARGEQWSRFVVHDHRRPARRGVSVPPHVAASRRSGTSRGSTARRTRRAT